MKKIIIAISVLVIFITAGILEQIFIKKLFVKFGEEAEEIRALVENKNFALAHDKTLELQKSWEEKKHIVEAIISHNETKEITLRLAELEGYISAEDEKSAIATAAIAKDYCDNLIHILGFCWDTVL